jgi:hypothetical protein
MDKFLGNTSKSDKMIHAFPIETLASTTAHGTARLCAAL